jgi:hypothetical protein
MYIYILRRVLLYLHLKAFEFLFVLHTCIHTYIHRAMFESLSMVVCHTYMHMSYIYTYIHRATDSASHAVVSAIHTYVLHIYIHT